MSGLVGSQDPLLWYVNRSTGLVLLVLLTLSVALGVLAGRRSGGPSGIVPRFVPQAVHRSTGLLSLLLLAVHAGSSVADEYVDIRWWHAFVPVGLQYRPEWLALGVVASDVLLAAVVTSLLRTRLGHRHWRTIHLATYAAWGAAFLHGITIGTDTGLTLVVGTYTGCGAVVALALITRVVTAARHRTPAPRATSPIPGPVLSRRPR